MKYLRKRCRTTLLLALFLVPTLSFSQDSIYDSIPLSEAGVAEYELIFETKGSQDTLFSKAKLFIAQMFRNAKSVIQSEDRNAGAIVGKGNIDFMFPIQYKSKKKVEYCSTCGKGNAAFTMKIFTKDGKVKMVLTDFYVTSEYYISNTISKYDLELSKTPKKDELVNYNSVQAYRGIDQRIRYFMSLFENYMKKKAENDF